VIVGGTHVPGVPASVFGGLPHTALRLEMPDPRVIDFVSDYYVLDSAGPEVMGAVEWAMPGSANLRFFFGARPYNVRIGARIFDPVPVSALYGPTGRALRFETFGDITVGMGITPLGWARLFRRPAYQFCDRVVPITDAIPGDFGARLRDVIARTDMDLGVKAALDAFFLSELGEQTPDEPVIRRLMALIVDETVDVLAEIAERVGLTPQQLRALSLRYFGFPPKRLLRRARFLRSLMRMYASEGEPDYSLRSHSYFDASHFLRDSEAFLGTTPRRFMAMQTPFLRQILRARTAVFGVPAQALHSIADPQSPDGNGARN
jgi:AraC-like DNA-binding protein